MAFDRDIISKASGNMDMFCADIMLEPSATVDIFSPYSSFLDLPETRFLCLQVGCTMWMIPCLGTASLFLIMTISK